jgi:hypothetical protein
MAHRIGHSQDGEAERERDAHETYAEFGKARCENGAAATAEDEPECAEGLGSEFLHHRSIFIL